MQTTEEEYLSTIKNLQTQLLEYRSRAETAEETLRAIQSGEVDAQVVCGQDSEQIYPQEGADRTYRMVIESVQEGVATVQADGTILYANQCMSKILGLNLQKLPGSCLYDCVYEKDQPVYASLIHKALGSQTKAEITLRRLDGSAIPVLFSLTGVDSQGEPLVCLVVTDLTEQKIQAEIATSEQLSRSILDQASESIVVCDLDGTIIRVSHAVYNLATGYVLFQPFEKALPLSFEQGVDFSIQAVLQGQSFHGLEAVLKTTAGETGSQGREKYLLISATPLRKYAHEVLGCIVTLTDITRLKQAEEEQRASQKKIQEIIGSIQDGFMELDCAWRFSYINTRAAQNVGFAAEQLIGKNIWDVFPAILGTEQETLYRKVMAGRQPDQMVAAGPITNSWYDLHVYPSSEGITIFWTDISERKRIEEAKALSDQRFRLALKHSPITVAAQDSSLRFTWAYNQRTLDPESVIGKTDEDISPPETAARLVKLKRRVLETGKEAHGQFWVSSGGRQVFLTAFIEPVRGETGQITGINIATVDLTDIKKKDEALAVSEQRYHSLFDSMAEGFAIHELILDENGQPVDYRFLDVNPAFERMTGLKRADLIGQRHSSVLPQNDPYWLEIYSKVALTGEPVVFENLSSALNRYYQVSAYRPAPNQFATVFMEITDRKRSEARIQFQAQILNTLYDAVVVTDPEYRITDWNQGAERTYGWTAAEVLGKFAPDLFHSEMSAEKRAAIYKGLAAGRPAVFEVFQSTKDNRRIYTSGYSIPYYDSDGERKSIVTVNRDMTDWNLREKELTRLNRTLLAHSQSSQAMLRASDETSYLQDVCRIITRDCGHRMVWIGFAQDDEEKSVIPAASDGFEEGYLESLHLTWADTERGRGPTGTAIRTGAVCQCRNMITDPAFAPWREEAIKRGYSSSIVFPLMSGGNAIGALTIYSRETDLFSDHEIDLLSNLVNDLVYGITTLRLREKQKKIEKELEQQREWLQVTLTSIGDGVVATDADGLVTFVNPVAAGLTGWPAEEAIGQPARSVLTLVDEASHQPVEDIIAKTLKEKRTMTLANHTILISRGGQAIPVEDSAAPILDETGYIRGVVVVFHDVTRRKLAERKLEEAQVEVTNERNRLLAVMQALPVGVALLDAQGGQLDNNPSFDRIWGIPRPKVGKVEDYAAYHAYWVDTGLPVRPDEWASAQSVQKGRTVIGQKIKIERFDGSRAQILNNSAPVFDDQGKIVGCAVAVIDMTEQARLEEELRQAQEQIAWVINDVTERTQSIQTLEKRVVDRTREVSSLLAISTGIGSNLELNQLMENILDQLALIVPATSSIILIKVQDHFEVLALRDGDRKIPAAQVKIPLNASIKLSQLITERQPILIEDIADEPGDARSKFIASFFAPAGLETEFRSWLGVPMIAKKQVLGILSLAHLHTGAYSHEQIQLVQAVANQAAGAIENVALYTQAKNLAVINERQHLARELHDSVCQNLYGISLGTHVAIATLNQDPQKLQETLQYILSLADSGLTEMRAMIFDLRPEMLQTEGLGEAIRKQVSALQARRGVLVTFRMEEEPDVSYETKEVLYRIAMEAMNNASKHAVPTRIDIELNDKPGGYELVIRDNGVGFDTTRNYPGHLGLISMRERAEQIHGNLLLESSPGNGTTITVNFPALKK